MSDWITDRLPTAADADGDGDVRVPAHPGLKPDDPLRCPSWQHYSLIVPGQPWWSPKAAAAVTSAPPPTPDATRKVTLLTATTDGNRDCLYAHCNDGTLWVLEVNNNHPWHELPAITQRKAAGGVAP